MLIVGAEAKGGLLRYETILDRSLPPVMAEPTGIEQVLINFILNARDAGAHLIRIEVAPAPGRAGHLRLSISDDGAGIASDVLTKLFQPFFTTKAKGTGLGLWLSQRIIQDHGGSVSVESVVGKGTTFAITLPTMGDSSSGRIKLSSRDESPTPSLIAAARSSRSSR
jgi:signal transduction histidine kinase